jgi:hypothetical protein
LITRCAWDSAPELLLAELPSMPSTDGDFAPAIPSVSAVGERAAIARGNAVEVYELPGSRCSARSATARR